MKGKKEEESIFTLYLIWKISSGNLFEKIIPSAKIFIQIIVSRVINSLHYTQQNFSFINPIFQGFL